MFRHNDEFIHHERKIFGKFQAAAPLSTGNYPGLMNCFPAILVKNESIFALARKSISKSMFALYGDSIVFPLQF